MRIASVGRALPPHYYDQERLTAALRDLWSSRHGNVRRLESLHRNVLVGGRHLALPLEAYGKLPSFTEANNAFIRCGLDLGERALRDGLERARLYSWAETARRTLAVYRELL